MTCLLDVSTLLALLWDLHVNNERVTAWQKEVEFAVCPLTELGFLRISTQRNFGATVAEARKVLRDWKRAQNPQFIVCDLDALESEEPPVGTGTTDFYLPSLAAKHGMRLATLDECIAHPAALVIPDLMIVRPRTP
jgi:predicted nucleic acid-binding protein